MKKIHKKKIFIHSITWPSTTTLTSSIFELMFVTCLNEWMLFLIRNWKKNHWILMMVMVFWRRRRRKNETRKRKLKKKLRYHQDKQEKDDVDNDDDENRKKSNTGQVFEWRKNWTPSRQQKYLDHNLKLTKKNDDDDNKLTYKVDFFVR